MRLLSVITLALTAITASAAPQGIDVSSYQPNIDWSAVKANGVEFAYIKATEGTSMYSPKLCSFFVGDAQDVTTRLYKSLFLQPIHWCNQR